MTEGDQDIYKDFNLTVSERWQQEIAGKWKLVHSQTSAVQTWYSSQGADVS